MNMNNLADHLIGLAFVMMMAAIVWGEMKKK
jgi:hypothetical protein